MKLQGPMMSFGASGSIGGLVTMATWKGRPYARQLVIPSNPKSANQVAFRSMFRFLSQAWGNLATIDQESWLELAQAGNYSTFNAYMRYNQDLWTRTVQPTANPANSPAVITDTAVITPTAGVKSISLSIAPDMGFSPWGYILYQKVGSAPTGIFSEVVYVIEALADPQIFNVTGLTSGTTVHFKVQGFTEDQEIGALSADASATVL